MAKRTHRNATTQSAALPAASFISRHWLSALAVALLASAAMAWWFVEAGMDVDYTKVNNVATPPAQATMVDEQQCQSCHGQEFAQWQGSHHQLAMQVASPSTVLGDFNDVTFKGPTETSRFFRKGDEFWVNTPGPDGRPADFLVSYTFGLEPLQQYLLALPGGRIQPLGVAWDTQKKVWFSLYPNESINFADDLHWSGAQQNANFMCIECHTTGFKRNFDAKKATFASHWQALGVGCQSCHGPASVHLDWAKQPDKQGNPGFSFSPSSATAANEVETCARCHSRRAPLGDGFTAHKRLFDDYLPNTLAPLLYEVDGQIKDEVFEYGSFSQSKMYAKGVRCSDCHNPHSAELKAPGDGVCLQCHNPAGKAANPQVQGAGLLAKDYESREHHQHTPGAAGSQCVDCHMPGKLYMGNDYRHDHSFSIPDPERALALGSRDACLTCHVDTPVKQVVQQFEQWFPSSADHDGGYARALQAIRAGQPGAAKVLDKQLQRGDLPPIRRATLLAELPAYPSVRNGQVLMLSLKSPSAEVRLAAVDALPALLPPQQQVEVLGPMLSDSLQAVRMNTAFTLASLPREQLGRYSNSWQQAIKEYEEAQLTLADRAEANLNLAMLYQSLGRNSEVEPALRAAIARDRNFLPAQVTLAQWLESQGDAEAGLALLTDSVKAHPQGALLQHALGLALIRRGLREEALQAFTKAVALEPDNGQYAYVLAIALHDAGQTDLARKTLGDLLTKQPTQRDARLALISYAQQAQDMEQIQQLLGELQAINPDDPLLQKQPQR